MIPVRATLPSACSFYVPGSHIIVIATYSYFTSEGKKKKNLKGTLFVPLPHLYSHQCLVKMVGSFKKKFEKLLREMFIVFFFFLLIFPIKQGASVSSRRHTLKLFNKSVLVK